MNRLIAVDPGLDVTGWAVFEPGRDSVLVAPVSTLVVSGEIRTTPAQPLAQRLGRLHSEILDVCVRHDPATAVIEVPAIEGQYKRGGAASRKGVNRLYMATGVLMTALSGWTDGRLVEHVSRTRKQDRYTWLGALDGYGGFKLPRGPAGGDRPDEWDAIWIGMQYVGEYVVAAATRPAARRS